MDRPTPENEQLLEALQEQFLAALEYHRRGDVDSAVKLLEGVLQGEPRLAEPRLELGRIELEMEHLEEAELQTREALRILLAGGQWVDDISEEQMLSVAHGQLAEVLRLRADSNEVVFGDPEVFKTMLAEAKAHFDESSRLDPDNAHAGYFAFQMEGEDGVPEP